MTVDDRAHALMEQQGWSPEQRSDPLYDTAHRNIAAAIRNAVNEALERAAVQAECDDAAVSARIAAEIRALKEPTP